MEYSPDHDPTNSITFSFEGGQSGYNATIICGNGHYCGISCFGGSCNNLTLICDGNCTFMIDCKESIFLESETNIVMTGQDAILTTDPCTELESTNNIHVQD